MLRVRVRVLYIWCMCCWGCVNWTLTARNPIHFGSLPWLFKATQTSTSFWLMRRKCRCGIAAVMDCSVVNFVRRCYSLLAFFFFMWICYFCFAPLCWFLFSDCFGINNSYLEWNRDCVSAEKYAVCVLRKWRSVPYLELKKYEKKKMWLASVSFSNAQF